MQTEKGIKKAEKALASKKPELVTIEAHIMHATWKMNNTEKSKEEVVKDLKTRQENLFDRLQTELKSVRRDADKAQEKSISAQHSANRGKPGRALKSSSSKLAVDERQTLEALREEKTSSRTLARLTEKQKGYEEKKELRSKDLRVQTARKTEVKIEWLSGADHQT